MLFRTLFDSLKGFTSLRGRRSRSQRSQRRHDLRRLISIDPLESRILPAAVLTISDAVIVEGNSGVKQAAVVVSLSDPHGNAVTVDYRTVAGGATAGSDFTAVSNTLSFTKNQSSKTIFIPVLGDRLAEADEQFSIVLSNAKGAKIADGTGVVTIQDDEPRISITDSSGNEGNSGSTPFKFTISLSSASDLPVTVNYATANGSASSDNDYTAVSNTYTFAPGETSKDIYVNVNGDLAVESNETFVVNVTSSDALITKGAGTGTIYDDEPQISISDAYFYDGNGETALTFYVSLSAPSTEVVTVDYETFDDGWANAGIDYAYTKGTLTFAPGDTVQTFTVQVLSQSTYDQYFYVQLSNASANASITWSTAVGYLNYYGYYGYGYYDYGYYYY